MGLGIVSGTGSGSRRISYEEQKKREADDLALRAARQNTELQRQQYDDNKAAQENASKLAQRYLNQWNSWNQKTYGLTNKAIENLDETIAWLRGEGGTNESISQLDTLSKTAMDDWTGFMESYRPLEQEYMDASREGMAAQKGVNERFLQMLETDPTGVSGDAMADVASASNLSRKEESRRLTGLGMDPTSGKFRNAMKSSYMDEALNKALASNQARNLEQQRVQGLITDGPSNAFADQATGYGNLFVAGRNASSGMLRNATDASTAAVNARTGIADTVANLTNTQAGLTSGLTQIGQGYGELGSGLLGASNYNSSVAPSSLDTSGSGYNA